ncbi:MAG: radical SAM protein, partial [Deltaproteobacteria bacterium]
MKFNRINIEITNVCNLKCSFCVEPERKVGFMTEALFRKVLTEVAPLTRIITFHVLGEPLLHPEIGKFISLANDAGLKVFLVTNGTLIKKRAKELLHPALRQINFSLHSYGHSGNKGSLQDYLFPIFAWTEAAFELYPRLFINYRIWDLNERGETVGSHEAILTEIEAAFGKKLPRTLEEKKNFIIKKRLSLHFDTEFDWPSLK